jgi:hypothetical protein
MYSRNFFPSALQLTQQKVVILELKKMELKFQLRLRVRYSLARKKKEMRRIQFTRS